MTRQLRPRKSKPNYASLADFDDAGPSTTSHPTIEDEVDSGSDFEPLIAGVDVTGDAAYDGDEDANFDGVDEDESIGMVFDPEAVLGIPVPSPSVSAVSPATPSTRKGKGKGKAGPSVIPSPAWKTKRQQYALPTPSVHHRHRAVPLFADTTRVERLTSPPDLFGPSSVVWTNNFTSSQKVTDRVQKAWGFNVAEGPIWELVENRGWYKEAYRDSPLGDEVGEAKRRPRTHQGVRVKDGWQILTEEDGAPYFPSDPTTEECESKLPSSVKCYFGPFQNQKRYDMKMFDMLQLSSLFQDNNSVVFNAGAPVWGIDWCPVHANDREGRGYKQYLAVAPFPSSAHFPEIGVHVSRPSPACIQIWSYGPADNVSKETPVVECEMVICVDGGPAYEIKWCPLPSHDLYGDQIRPRKLGLLGGTFEDGSFAIYAIPDPADVKPQNSTIAQPVFVKLPDPLIRIELEEASCWVFDWANSEVVAIGTTNGAIAVYNVGPALANAHDSAVATVTGLLPTHYLSIHQSAIRSLCWIRAPPSGPSGLVRKDDNPSVIASGGYDGVECLTDIREGHGSVMNRTRDVINTMTYSPYVGGPITIDHENIVKAYSTSSSMLGRGHTLMDPQGPVWTVSASDYHPQLAVGSADGTCATTNTLRTTRRGGSVPFFVHRIYRMDYNRKTGEFRMLEHFLPQEMQERPSQASGKKANSKSISSGGTGVWPWQVGVQRVVWNTGNGPASSGLLASATASGLCRIDVLQGRWIKNKVPYGSIERIRGEDGEAMDVDSDDYE